jgi:hypothetical protein
MQNDENPNGKKKGVNLDRGALEFNRRRDVTMLTSTGPPLP